MYRFEQLEELQIPLVNKFYKQSRYSSKAGRGESIFVLKDSRGIVAAVRLEPKGSSGYFLRAMCVAPGLRGQGLGSLLLEYLECFLADHSVYCYPFDHLESFYARAGFTLQSAEEITHSVREPFLRYQQQGRKICIMVNQRFLSEVGEISNPTADRSSKSHGSISDE